MVMPDQFSDTLNNLIDRPIGPSPIESFFKPFPESFNRIVFGRIGRQPEKDDPAVLFEKVVDAFTGMDAAVIDDEHDQGVGKDLMELVEKGDKGAGRPLSRSFPVEALGPTMQGAKECGPLPVGGRL